MVDAETLTQSTTYGALTISIISVILAGRSARIARRQADIAENANEHARQSGAGANVIHFTSRFFDLMKGGARFDDPDWEYQFWSLQATEFYFFDNGWLPGFIYELWMVELSNGYRALPHTIESHHSYMQRYATNYPAMVEFFDGIAGLARAHFESDHDRNRAVGRFVGSWRQSRGPSVPKQRAAELKNPR